MHNEHDANEALARSARLYRQNYVPPRPEPGAWAKLALLAGLAGLCALFAVLLVQWLCTGAFMECRP